MKRHFLGLGILLSAFSFGACKTATPTANNSLNAARPSKNEIPGDFKYSFDIAEFKGMTYLAFMKDHVKPGLDDIATNGYTVANGDAMQATYDASGPKITRGIDGQGDEGLEQIKKIANKLAGKNVNLKTLPGKIHDIDKSVSQYNLATFIGLASGGGVKIKYAPKNYSLNIHYDTVEKKSGRSFGIGPAGGFNDISDRDYLVALGKYAKDADDGMAAFYNVVFMTLLNNDTSGYSEVSAEGQSLLSNFLAVYTAEQDRNLMDGRTTPYWDAALLEVTLIAGFHANQAQFKLFYWDAKANKSTFTAQTNKQTPCNVPFQSKVADMTDYWQFSRNVNDPANCKRSGINITNREFRQLGTSITAYMTAKHPDIVKSVKAALGSAGTQSNLFYGFSNLILSDKAPKKFPAATIKALTTSWIKLLTTANKEAKAITTWIEKGGGGSSAMDPNEIDPSYPAIDDEPNQAEDVI